MYSPKRRANRKSIHESRVGTGPMDTWTSFFRLNLNLSFCLWSTPMFGFNRGFGHHCRSGLWSNIVLMKMVKSQLSTPRNGPFGPWMLFTFCLKIYQRVSWMGHPLDFHLDLPKLPKKFKASNSSKLGTNKFEEKKIHLIDTSETSKRRGFFPWVFGGSISTSNGFRSRKSDLGAKRSRSLPPGPIRRRSGLKRGARWKTPED